MGRRTGRTTQLLHQCIFSAATGNRVVFVCTSHMVGYCKDILWKIAERHKIHPELIKRIEVVAYPLVHKYGIPMQRNIATDIIEDHYIKGMFT